MIFSSKVNQKGGKNGQKEDGKEKNRQEGSEEKNREEKEKIELALLVFGGAGKGV